MPFRLSPEHERSYSIVLSNNTVTFSWFEGSRVNRCSKWFWEGLPHNYFFGEVNSRQWQAIGLAYIFIAWQPGV
jgi:hypothetical protein